MRLFISILITAFCVTISRAQSPEDFELLHQVKSTPLKDQQSSGTCWSFATISFLETEALRMGKDSIALSPMFFVHPAYLGKAEKFIESKGNSYFGAGDLTFSVLNAYENFGAIPETVYDGIIEGDWRHDHFEMDNLLIAMVESIGKSGYDRIKPYSWRYAIEGVLNAYLGEPPATFVYKGKLHTPKSFANEHVGINPYDYIEITSYTHLPFYKMSALVIPANWNNNKYLNIPINDFERVVDHALEKGYSLAWDGDATEPEFDFEAGLLKLPEEQENLKITQELRQKTFEDGTTSDDHNMHLIGKVKNADGEIYYLLKNSEGNNDMNGYIYMSKNALLLKTISLLVHKDGIPKEIRQKANLNFK